MIYDYDVVATTSTAELELVELVKRKIMDGWQPIGGVSRGAERFFQAVVKQSEDL